eukprot:CAMPEP_0194029208 /NCGR_PEP_ID=MMETSP0009_2-20130614/3008_1 /TAXON_ID=210454 /ORGANISM="Grammatophora oceanica, Strain CCMP 410" /LENGTH=691 /DNA_ID=CAMNT_0038668815 /DNA_START=154 /DNA_END=2229 /DNA_ORIENTATION=-
MTIRQEEASAHRLMEKFVKERTGFQMLPSNFKFPLHDSFGYAYDAETKRFYVAGGRKKFTVSTKAFSDKLYELELVQEDASSTSTSSLSPRILRTVNLPHGKGIRACACVMLNKKVYVIGGFDDGGKTLNTMHSFDVTTSRWQEEASMNTERDFASASVVRKRNDAIFVSGGKDSKNNSLNSCEEYNDSTNQWTVSDCRLKEARHRHVSICCGSRVLVAGGYNSATNQSLFTTEVLDLESSASDRGPPLVEKRAGGAASMVGDYLIVSGGNNDSTTLRSCEAIALSDVFNGTGRWHLLPGLEMQERRSYFGMVLVGNTLMATAGKNLAKNQTYESIDVSLLLQSRQPAEEPNVFFSQVLKPDTRKYTMDYLLETMVTSIGSIYDTKLFYSFVKQCLRLDVIERSTGDDVIKACLERSAEMCSSNLSYTMFMLILKKVREDDIATADDFNRFKDQAEVSLEEGGPTIEEMKATIDANTEHIDGLDLNVECLRKQIGTLCKYVDQSNPKSDDTLKRKLSRRHRIEAATSFITSVVTAISLGVDGGSPHLPRAFQKILVGIVDFGDPAHIRAWIESLLNMPYNLGPAYREIREKFESGVSHAPTAGDWAGGDAVFALGIIAALAYGDCSGAQKQDDDVSKGKRSEAQKEEADKINNSKISASTHQEDIDEINNSTTSKNDQASKPEILSHCSIQ